MILKTVDGSCILDRKGNPQTKKHLKRFFSADAFFGVVCKILCSVESKRKFRKKSVEKNPVFQINPTSPGTRFLGPAFFGTFFLIFQQI
jgi:hypothetical protein